VLVSGSIGDGRLGLMAARGELDELGASAAALAERYRLPQPRLELADALRGHASAAADVSDGLAADAGHIGEASGVAIELELERLPLSPAALAWLQGRPDRGAALAELASGGDDYEVVCTARPDQAPALIRAAAAVGLAMTDVGAVREGQGTRVLMAGRPVELEHMGWRHG
jgi:thiamine-monophosphate kinase